MYIEAETKWISSRVVRVISQSVWTAVGADRDGEEKRGRISFYVRTLDRQECHDEDSEAEASPECWKPERGGGVSSRFIVRRSRESRNGTYRCNFADNGGFNYLPVVEKGKRRRQRVAPRQYARLLRYSIRERRGTWVPLTVCFSGILIS